MQKNLLDTTQHGAILDSMNLKTYIDLGGGRRKALADAVNSSPAYISQLAHGFRRASPQLAKQIEAATEGMVPRASLRPDLWGEAA